MPDIIHFYNYSQQIDIDRGLERIECTITNYLSTVDVFTVAQRAAAILTTGNPVIALVVVSGNSRSVVQPWYKTLAFHGLVPPNYYLKVH